MHSSSMLALLAVLYSAQVVSARLHSAQAPPAPAAMASPGGAPGPSVSAEIETVKAELVIQNMAYEEVMMHEEAYAGIRDTIKAFVDKEMEAAVGPPGAPGPAAGPAPAPAALLDLNKPIKGHKKTAPVATSHTFVNVAHSAGGPAPAPAPGPGPAPGPEVNNVDSFVALSEGPLFDEMDVDLQDAEEAHSVHKMEGHMDDKEHEKHIEVVDKHVNGQPNDGSHDAVGAYGGSSHHQKKLNKKKSLVQKKGQSRLAVNTVKLDAWVVASDPAEAAKLDAKMKEIWHPTILANVLMNAKGIHWAHPPQIEVGKPRPESVKKFQLDCSPHVEKLIGRFEVAYTRAQVPAALESACHLFDSKISFSGNRQITSWDRRACKVATERLMKKWGGGEATAQKWGKVNETKANYTKPDYSGWCHDLCELKLGHGAPQCHL